MNILHLFITQHALAQASQPAATSAVDAALGYLDPTNGAFEGKGGTNVVFSMMEYFLDLMPTMLGALAFLGIIYSAVLYLGAMGDPSKLETAKKNITWIATGIIAIALVLIAIKVVVNIIGKTS